MAASAMLAGAVAGCAGGIVSPTDVGGSYDPHMLNYVAGKGDLYTRVIGNPFAADMAALETAVTGSMYGSHFGQPIRFNTARNPENTSPYHVVVLFNPSQPVTAAQICADPAGQATDAAGARLRVVMTFCSSNYYETSVSGQLDQARGPDDPAFHTLIRQMTTELLPPRNPDPNGGVDFNS
ncbi:MAG: hypothetical protein ACE5DS_10465 [Kiloniellaceae bacterium]